MNTKYEYDTVQVHTTDSPKLFKIKASEGEFEIPESLPDVLKIVPNILQQEQNGGWETYSTLVLNGAIIFLIRKPISVVLVPSNIHFRG